MAEAPSFTSIGPWVAYYDSNADEWSVRIKTTDTWGVYREIAHIGADNEAEANAHLMSAGPDMHAALKGFLTYHGGHVLTCPELAARMKAGYEAIAKAEGKS